MRSASGGLGGSSNTSGGSTRRVRPGSRGRLHLRGARGLASLRGGSRLRRLARGGRLGGRGRGSRSRGSRGRRLRGSGLGCLGSRRASARRGRLGSGIKAALLGSSADLVAIVLPDVVRHGAVEATAEEILPLGVLAVAVLGRVLNGVACMVLEQRRWWEGR